jgi:hypothetical protein
MPIMIKKIVTLLIANVVILSLSAEENPVFENMIYDDEIKTVRMHHNEWELSWPYYEMHSDIQLVLSFDDLRDEPRNFEYRIVHCNQDWTKSNLFFSDYMDGFERNPLEDYEMSMNTMIPYTHYELLLPNDDIEFRTSGNYVVLIYDTENPEKPILSRRFFVVDQEISIDAEVKQPVLGLYKSLGHDVRLSLKTQNMQFYDIFNEINVCVMQNNQWDGMKCNLEPDFIQNDEVVFHRDDQAVFKASNEYRILNMRNLKFTNDKMVNIEFDDPNYFITLHPDKNNQFMQYLDRDDFNGRFVISNRDGWESKTDADYVHVLFRVPARLDQTGGSVHVYGELTNWRCDDSNKMLYNTETGMYEKELFLKQGAYSYRYVQKQDGNVDHMRFEGSHWETENDYLILVYYRDLRLGADRIIGLEVVNSHPE